MTAKGLAIHLVQHGVLLLAFSIATSAQAEKLPPLLRPSDYAIDRAKEMGGEAVKLLPMEYDYERGRSGGASYSFKDRSYGGANELGFLRGEFLIYGGRNYGFFADLGKRDLREVDRSSPEAAYFLSYKPPKLEPDIRSEIERLKEIKIDGVKLTGRVAVQVGQTYLLRSIDYIYGSDIAVVLHVLENSTDGTTTIVWKEMAKFPQPVKLFMPDEEMQRKVDAVLSELQIRGLQVKIEDNRLVPIGVDIDQEFGRFREALHERKIQYRGIDFSMMKRSEGKVPK